MNRHAQEYSGAVCAAQTHPQPPRTPVFNRLPLAAQPAPTLSDSNRSHIRHNCGPPIYYGSGGLKPTPVRASLAVFLFAQNKRSPPHYAVNTKPMSSAAVRALQMTGLLLYFWSQQKIPFWIAECKWGWGFAVKARRFR